jgi:hypothetical protein
MQILVIFAAWFSRRAGGGKHPLFLYSLYSCILIPAFNLAPCLHDLNRANRAFRFICGRERSCGLA